MFQVQPYTRRKDKMILKSVAQKVAITPFFIVQLRLSLQNGPRHYFGVIDCADSIIVREGALALWRGLPFDIIESILFKQTPYMVYQTAQHQVSLMRKTITALLFMNLEYCRIMIKIDNHLTYKELLRSLISSYATKNGRYALLGSLLVYGSHVFFSKIRNFFTSTRRLPLQNNILFRGFDTLMAALIVFPLTNLGYYMIANKTQLTESLSDFTLAQPSVTIFFVFVQASIKYFFEQII